MQKNIQNTSNKKILSIVAGVLAALVMLTSFVIALSKFGENVITDVSDLSQVGEDVSSNVSGAISDADNSVDDVSDTVSEWGNGGDGYFASLVMENYPYSNASSYSGPLALVGGAAGTYPQIDQSKLVNISKEKTSGVYGLANTSLVIYDDAMADMDRFIVGFYEQVPKNGIIVNKGYTSVDALVPTEASIDLASGYTFQLSIYNSNYKFSSPEFAYLKEQSYKYGIIQRYPAEKSNYTGFEESSSIYRYVGLAHSMYMNHYRHSLEEYIDKIRTQKVIEYKSELELNTMYVIYYVTIDDSVETTYVPLPSNENCTYTVSGDGGKGFIVTVKIPME